MLSIKEAARSAMSFYKDIYPDTQGELIEEVELDAERHYWFITLSFLSKIDTKNPVLAAVILPQFERKYKRFKVNVNDGQVEAMTIRIPGNDAN